MAVLSSSGAPPATAGEGPGAVPPRRRALPEGSGTAAVLVVAWLALIGATLGYRHDFLSHQTILSVTFTMAVAGVLTLAESLVAISGGLLDLSIPASVIMSAWVISALFGHGAPTWEVLVGGLATGTAWGAINASIIVFGRLNPIIVTLGTNFAGTAVLNIYVKNAQVPLSSGFARWGRGYFLGLPNVFWPMLAAVVLVGFFLPRTRIGRRVLAVGGNPGAATVRGISLRKVRFGVFTAAGFLSGFAAVLFTASQSSFVSNDGDRFLFTAIAATLVAGIGLSGGYGNLWLTFLSVGLLSTIPTSLAFFRVPPLWQLVPPGVILVIAVSIDGYRQLRSAR